jgi:hypothetical protein
VTLAVRRASIIAAVVAVLLAVSLANGAIGRASPVGPAPASFVSASAVVPAGAGTSSWFCAGGSGPQAGGEETVVIVNSTAAPVHGTVTAIPSRGASRSVAVTVPAGGMWSVVPAQVAPGPWVSAAVEMDQGGVGVEETVATPLGWAETPCSSSTASSWYFASGSTAGNDGVALSVLNPGVTAAVVDTSFATASGAVLRPAAYQGVTVAPGSLVIEYVSDHDEGDPSFATTVTAVSGSVVAAELQSYTAAGHTGVALETGVPQPSTSWSFPLTEEISGGVVRFHVYDPGGRPARVSMSVGFAQGSASPMTVTVPAGLATTITTERQSRLPVGTPYWVRFTSADGVGVVVAREVQGPSGGPAPVHGLVLGAPAGSDRWLLPSITGPGTSPWGFAVVDLAGHPVSVRVSSAAVAAGSAPVSGSFVGPFTVDPSAPRIFAAAPPSPIGLAPIVVAATGPIAVELDPEPVAAPGVVEIPAMPIG